MICLPPTSIALSESDVDFHLREIEIKEQLYAQGFTREEVQRYYGEPHGSVNGSDVDDDDVHSTRPASVAMANAREESARSAEPLVVKGERCRSSDEMSTRRNSFSEDGRSWQKPSSTYPGPVSSSPMSVPSSPPVMQSSLLYRHAAVRQSSLLRIMHNAGSQPSTGSRSSSSAGSLRDESKTGPIDFLRYPATRTRSYRPRSKTYTYIESEAEPPTPASHAKDGPSSSPPSVQRSDRPDDLTSGTAEHSPRQTDHRWNPHSVPFSPETEASSPLTLPPFPVSRRTFSLQVSLPDRTRSSTSSSFSQPDDHDHSAPLLQSDSLVGLGNIHNSIINHLPTIPSTPSALAEGAATSFSRDNPTNTAIIKSDTSTQRPSFFSMDALKTPTRAPPQTEPRNPPHRHHGTFGVYNDDLTAEIQPQTPADLQSPRRRAVTEQNVAYTAPPGQIRTAGRLLGGRNDGEPGGGVQSPTMRAARMRERRAREFRRWRSVRMEGLRVGSVENEDEDENEGIEGVEVGARLGMDGSITPELARGRFNGMGRENEEEEERRLVRAWVRFSRERRVREMDWRDEFDEDRVGEENFDGMDLVERTERGRGTGRGRIIDGGEEEHRVVGFGLLARTPEP